MFKRKNGNLIPPVEPSHDDRPSYRPTGIPRDADPYTNYERAESDGPPTSGYNPSRDGFNRSAPIGGFSSRRGDNVDAARQELFSGYKRENTGSGRFFDGPKAGREPPPGEENEEDIEAIKQQTRYVRQESVNSTRNALRLAREAEETGINNLQRLGAQSEALANTELHLDISAGHSARAEDRTSELKKLNRSIFVPVITFNKDARRAKQDAKYKARHEAELESREEVMKDYRSTQQVVEKGIFGGGSGSGQERRAWRSGRTTEEATASDEDEEELGSNLDDIEQAVRKLKGIAVDTNAVLDKQNSTLNRITGKVDKLDSHIFTNTSKLNRVK